MVPPGLFATLEVPVNVFGFAEFVQAVCAQFAAHTAHSDSTTRSAIVLGLNAGPKVQVVRKSGDPLDKLWSQRVMEINTLGGGTYLPGVEQRGPRHAGYGHVEVGILGHDEGIFTAEFQVELLHLRRDQLRRCAAPSPANL